MRSASMKCRAILAAVALALAGAAQAHCDTLDGPVVASARKALDAGNPAQALVWVRAADEAAIRAAFDEALAVRKGGGAARALADRYFFETLVRIHRAGEGADFTGLKPAGTINPAVLAADKALASGDLKPVDTLIAQRAHQGLEKNFHEVMALRARAKDPTDVAAGRAAASAYVEYVHYVERLHDAAETLSPHHAEAEQPSKHSH